MLSAHAAAVLLAATAAADAGREPVEPTVLSAGAVVVHQAAVGDVDRYSFALRAGQYAELAIDQQGVDVAETVQEPGGAVLVASDNACGPIGPDRVAFIAPADGVYVLRVTATNVAAPPRGAYEIRLEAIREPDAAAQSRVRAVKLAAEARGRAPKEAAEALELFRQAADAWAEVGDLRMQMWMQVAAAEQQQALGDTAGARKMLGGVVSTAVQLSDEWAEAHVRWLRAVSELALGELDAAKSDLDRSLSLHRAAGREGFAAFALRSLGDFYSRVGEQQTALDHVQEALLIFSRAGDVRQEAIARNFVGSVYMRLGDDDLALEQFRSAEEALRSVPRAALIRARALGGMATAHRFLGDPDTARREYREAIAICTDRRDAECAAFILLRRGALDRVEGDLVAARDAFASALSVYQVRDDPFDEGYAQCLLGGAYRRLKQPVAARAALEAGLATVPRAGPLVRIACEEDLARLDLEAGRLGSALALARSALTLSDSARAQIAGSGSRASSLAARQSLYDLVIDILMRRHELEPLAGHDVAAFEVSEQGRARTLLEVLGEDRSTALADIDSRLLDEQRALQRRLNTIAAQAEAEAGRTVDADARQRELDAISAQLAETQARIRRTAPRYAGLALPQPLTLPEIRTRVLDADTQLLQYALGDERSYAWVASSSRLASFRLAPRAQIEDAARRLHALLSTPEGAARADDARRELSRLLLAPAASALGAHRLVIVAPSVLQFVPFASLRLPDETPLLAAFEVVTAPSASVIATLRSEPAPSAPGPTRVAILADPVFDRADPRLSRRASRSAAALYASATEGDGGEPRQPLRRALDDLRGAGNRRGLARLPFSRREADAILALAPRAAFEATGFEASKSTAMGARLASYPIVHFATHGVLNTRRPELSGIVLSLLDSQGRPQDGFLRLNEIYGMRLSARLVVLSACQTALGREMRGEGLIGLTRGFMYAGAKAVVASLWQVDDESTAELMKRFYRGMLKENRQPADALRNAQLQMSRTKRWSAPFYWAGFVLQGEWR